MTPFFYLCESMARPTDRSYATLRACVQPRLSALHRRKRLWQGQGARGGEGGREKNPYVGDYEGETTLRADIEEEEDASTTNPKVIVSECYFDSPRERRRADSQVQGLQTLSLKSQAKVLRGQEAGARGGGGSGGCRDAPHARD
jgi:hypothetical protein